MTDQEVNKTIAEFMGYETPYAGVIEVDGIYGAELIEGYYTKSLDALVPVWKKLNCGIQILPQGNGYSCVVLDGTDNKWDQAATIQQAASQATAKAILELQKEEQ